MVDLRPSLALTPTVTSTHYAPPIIFSDLKIQLSDRTIPCHKIVLYMAAPFFRALLSGGFKESQPGFNTLPLLDEDPDAYQAVVEFVYHKRFTVPPHLYTLPFCCKVFALAHRFDLQDLQGYCGFRAGQAHLREDVPAAVIRDSIEQYEGIRNLVGGAIHVKFFKQTIIQLVSINFADLKRDPEFAEILSCFPRWNIALLKELHKRWETPSDDDDSSC